MITTTRLRLVALIATGVLAAACSGGGDGSSDDVASLDEDEAEQGAGVPDDMDELEAWASCMRDEGIDVPDPVLDEDGVPHIPGAGSDDDEPDDSAAAQAGGMEVSKDEAGAAVKVCGQAPAGVLEPTEEDMQQAQDEALAFAQCMRSEGIADFPDPDFSDEGPGSEPDQGPSDNDSADDPDQGDGPEANNQAPDEKVGTDQGLWLDGFGEIDIYDPATATAVRACEDQLGGRLHIPEDAPGGAGE